MLNNFKSNPKDYGLSNKDLEKRDQEYGQITTERANMKRQYDSYFEKKTTNPVGEFGAGPANKPDLKAMNSQQLWEHKKKQEQEQEDNIDDLIKVVKNTKQGGKNISKELKEQ
jgi:hypothetical protein